MSIELNPADFSGLRPKAWICVGAGFAREEIKARLLGPGGAGIVGEAVTGRDELCLRLTSTRKDRLLSGLARQEVLRALLSDRRLSVYFTELKRLKRQGNFYRRLDNAIQAGRMAFAHDEEAEVYAQRSQTAFGESPLRKELQALSLGYEDFLRTRGLWDPVMLLRLAREKLEEGWPERLAKPERVDHYTIQRLESLEASFWEAFGRHVEVRVIGAPKAGSTKAGSTKAELTGSRWRWEKWHTADDAAENLAEVLAQTGKYADDCILIPEAGSVRRSLGRALDSLGVPQADPRDPTRTRWDEAIKWALLPLQLVARGFERVETLEYLRTYEMCEEFFRWSREINDRGIRQGLESYARGVLTPAHERLSRLQSRLGGRKTCLELAQAHLEFLRERSAAHEEAIWVQGFFEQIWEQFVRDTAWVDRADRRAPLLYWVERLQARLAEAPAPVEKSKPVEGVAVYRVNQAPLSRPKRVWLLGIAPDALSAPVGDYWFTERERELLSSEFSVRSAIQTREERLSCLRAWTEGAEEVVVLDVAHDADGRERESLRPLLDEVLGEKCKDVLPQQPEEKGAHERWLPSFSPFRPLQPQKIKLPASSERVLTATALDDYSACPFLALARKRWELWDQAEPDTELAGHERGTILHEAVRLLLASRDENGAFRLSAGDALDEIWRTRPPRGLLCGKRVERYVKSRLVDVLTAFQEKEREYFTRSGARVVSMEDRKLKLEYDDFAIVGTPDRIDEHPAGFFILDYKSSAASLPTGAEMVDQGLRLQLPFYALATKRETGKQVAGLQFIELNRKAGRSRGIFFKEFNGKDRGKLTATTAASKSLLNRAPDEVWSVLEERIAESARAYLSGVFDAAPKKRQSCDSCMTQDLCGFRRLTVETEEVLSE